MKLITARWYDELIERREPSEEYQAVRQQRYQAARRQLENGIATALLLLPEETAQTLRRLETDLNQISQEQAFEEVLDDEGVLLSKALDALIGQGRKTLDVS